ncbi:MAG: DUF4301 family protein [Deltaproteobacteria bacterium]|nr:DUF4301 family protein [Deltaproteobacteria bacterium]
MLKEGFSEKDKKQITAHGLTLEEVERQLSIFKKGPRYLRLVRPCTTGDGIRRLGEAEAREFSRTFDQAVSWGAEPMKFVPASGAATRMFKALLSMRDRVDSLGLSGLRRKAKESENAAGTAFFLEHVKEFAFWPDLAAALEKEGLSPEKVLTGGAYGTLLDILLTDRGLGYASLPKGLIPFHLYGANPRTPVEEHLVEAAAYARNSRGCGRTHFTVGAEHKKAFAELIKRVGPDYERRFSARQEVGFSTQDPATDTIAVDLENRPFRTEDGNLVFRPGGHGALLRNLDAIRASVIFINNIDNVVCDRDKPERVLWKKALAGLLWTVRQEAFRMLELLDGSDENAARQALSFASTWLGVSRKMAPKGVKELSLFLVDRLDRPLRVCGMVKNEGDPGGAPFWVQEADGSLSLQIVESAQVNPDSSEQKDVFASSTHFNPVDLVCSTSTPGGGKYDLSRFVDPEAVFISRKSYQGRDLKALELPGLWNGSMSGWNTIFVEVPKAAFNPVKTVNDLLNPSHRV